MSRIKWTYEKVLAEAKKYQTRSEFRKGSNSALYQACKNGWYEDICKHMVSGRSAHLKWTKEKVQKVADKYQTITDFSKNRRVVYSTAHRNGWLEDVCAHMVYKQKPKGYWTIEKIKMIAKKYKSREEFRRGNSKAYGAARRSNCFDDVCAHMVYKQKPMGYWTIEKIKMIAKKYKTKKEFRESDYAAYTMAYKLKCMDEVSSHMEVLSSLLDRYIYAFEFNKTKCVYVGLTWNTNQREGNHNIDKRSSVYKYMQEMNLTKDDYVYKKFGYHNVSIAGEKEKDKIKEYKKQGWVILNRVKAGSLGPGIKKWTKDKCKEEAKKYHTKNAFKVTSSSAYNRARICGWLDDICGHMISGRYVRTKWTKENVLDEAKKYKSRSEFCEKSKGAYGVACKQKWLNEACDHMVSINKPKGYWDIKKVMKISKRYNNIKEFRDNEKPAYAWSVGNKCLEKVLKHMKRNTQKSGYWTKERVLVESKKYYTKKDFRRLCGAAYNAAHKKGWLDEICSHMKELKKPAGYWTKERASLEAKKYTSRVEFGRKNKSAYTTAHKKGWLDEICSHMIYINRPNGYWTKEIVKIEAIKYNSRSEFRKCNPNAYAPALRNGWLNEFFPKN